MEQNARLTFCFSKNQQFQLAVRERQQLAREAVSRAVLDSSVRFRMTLCMELRQAQLSNESAVQHIFLRLGNEAQEALRQRRAHMCTSKISSFKKEKHKSMSFGMVSEERASLRILESVSREPDLVRQEAQQLRENYHRSEQAALLSREEAEELTFQ